ncbi:fasciclin domain-containing protein [Tunicatimonas pelagia]|uniref:fasciclin domain-containing protein n=1 Tax=Tunicatimonas pelagia TaxID=931531 RepID=UPI002665ECFB|nr:fasciclin domain-containing protein [Tunicatimonas pelagia]WKN41956.1 fasciclin domain-containing protein [Tunicatimonas pelagia]
MRYFSFLFLFFVLVGCADKKQSVEEKEELEVESDVVAGMEKNEVRLGEGTVYETVGDNETLHFLENVLRSTGLDSVLSLEGPYTLFAPSDKAFEAMVPVGQNNLPDDMDQEELKAILMNHVVAGEYRATDLINEESLSTLGGGELKITKVENEITIDSANVVFNDRMADNGVVHIIDRVLVPN